MLSYYLTGLKKFIGIGKKIFLVITVYIFVLSLFLYFFNKDKPKVINDPIKKNRIEIYKIINDPKLNQSKEGKITIVLYRKAMCIMVGEACTNSPNDGDKNFNKSVFGLMAKLIALPYSNPPASGVYWAYSGLQNSGFIPITFAAEGLGFSALRPFMTIWKVFRDISYMLLVLILIGIGFMIMFRMKLNPQTVISVESALPKIVISLLLITFSFPIAGFMIDLMYVIILITIAVLGNRGNFFNITEFQNKYVNPGFGTLVDSLFPLGFLPTVWKLANSIVALLPFIINQILRLVLGIVGSVLFVKWLEIPVFKLLESISELGGSIPIGESAAAIIEILVKIIVGIILGLIGFGFGYISLSIIIFILVMFTFIFMMFRIFFLLFSTYIRVFLMIIFSPLFMLFEAIPGRNVFGYWFKTLFVELLTFPIVIILFVVTYLIINIIPLNGNLWRPPFLSQLDPESFTILLAIGILFLIPDLVKIVRELLGVKQLPVSLGLGTYFGGAGGALGGSTNLLAQFSSIKLAAPGLVRMFTGTTGKAAKFFGVEMPPKEEVSKSQGSQEPAQPTEGVPPKAGT